jgi:uncharacterized protein
VRSKALRAVARAANPAELSRRLAERSVRRATAVVWGVAALSAISALLALRLDSSATTATLFDRDSAASKATEQLHREFGGEPVIVLIRTRKQGCPGGRNCRLTDLLLTPDLIRVLAFEGCVSGNIPRGAKVPAPVCEKFAESKPFRIVNGPGTFINESARQISARIRRQQGRSAAEAEQAADAARRVAAAKGLSQAEQKRLAQQARQLAQRAQPPGSGDRRPKLRAPARIRALDQLRRSKDPVHAVLPEPHECGCGAAPALGAGRR